MVEVLDQTSCHKLFLAETEYNLTVTFILYAFVTPSLREALRFGEF